MNGRHLILILGLLLVIVLSAGAVGAQTENTPTVTSGGTGIVTGGFNRQTATWNFTVTSGGSANIIIPSGGLPDGEKTVVGLDGFAVNVDPSKPENVLAASDGKGCLSVSGVAGSVATVTTPRGVVVTIIIGANSLTTICDTGIGAVLINPGGAAITIVSNGIPTTSTIAPGCTLSSPADGNFSENLAANAFNGYQIGAGLSNPGFITLVDPNGTVANLGAGSASSCGATGPVSPTGDHDGERCQDGITPSGKGNPCD